MTDKEWKELYPLFTPRECGKEMNYSFMKKVLLLRLALDTPMYIIAGYATRGHAPHSYHYKGRALDFWCDLPARQVLYVIDRIGLFHGVGFYPWGAHKSWHIDDRPIERYQRWRSPEKGQYLYLLED